MIYGWFQESGALQTSAGSRPDLALYFVIAAHAIYFQLDVRDSRFIPSTSETFFSHGKNSLSRRIVVRHKKYLIEKFF